MLAKFKNFLMQMVAGANIVTVIIMLMVGYSDRLHPATFPLFANAGLLLPVFLVLNFFFLVFWVFFKFRWVVIPFAGYILCFQPVRTYCPFNITGEVPDSAIKVLSYNVWLFAGWNDNGNPNPILEYIASADADVVCLQEAGANEVGQRKIDNMLDPIYKYRDTMRIGNGGSVIAFYSKHPILHKQRIDYESRGNLSGAVWLDIAGDTVIVVNNHFETTGLTVDDKAQFRQLVKGEYRSDSVENASRKLFDKLKESTVRRAPEAEAVARFIASHSGETIICCGDFNDGPNSYARRTVAENLTDCYVATGNGPGISYHMNGFYVRIDNILCSTDLEPCKCIVDRKIAVSDHYPVVCWLKKGRKP